MSQEFGPLTTKQKRLLRILTRGLKTLKPEDLSPRTPCPDSWTLASYVSGDLNQEAQQAVNAHIAFCDTCFDEYAALIGQDKLWQLLQGERTLVGDIAEARFQKSMGWKKTVANFVRQKGQEVAKVLEVAVGGNTYSVALSLEGGALSCSVAALRTPLKSALRITVGSGTGKELISTRSDESGNSRFVVPSAAGDMRVLTLDLQGIMHQISFRIPQKP
jgi:hypothetical protein